MIDTRENKEKDILEVKAVETLSQADFDHLAPVLKKHIAETIRPRLLLILEEFHGWHGAGAFIRDLKMDAEYINEFDRIAVIGDAKWEEWGTKLVNPLTSNEIKFFEPAEIEHARRWLK